MQKLLPKLIVVAGVLLAIIAYVASNIFEYLHEPLMFDEAITIELKPGSSIRTLSNQLQSHNLLEHPDYFRIWGRLSGKATRLQAGEYVFSPGQAISELIDDMVAGRVRQYSLTLVEGWTFREFLNAVAAHEAIEHTLEDTAYDDIMSVLTRRRTSRRPLLSRYLLHPQKYPGHCVVKPRVSANGNASEPALD